jgi:hypothetical protein
MKKIWGGAWALITVGALAAILASAGMATPGVTATIQEVTVSNGPHQPPTGTFTASGLPGCTSGTLADQLVWFSPSGARLVVDRTYTCSEGGSFTARLGLHLSTVDASGDQPTDGTWRIISTAGALTGLQGTGSGIGVGTGCAPIGAIFAECAGSTGTTTASIH